MQRSPDQGSAQAVLVDAAVRLNEAESRLAYLEEQTDKTLQVGRIFAWLLLPTMGFFIFQDLVLIGLKSAWVWRLAGIVPALVFVVLAHTVLPSRRRWILPLHIAVLTGTMINICGMSAQLFGRDSIEPIWQYGLIGGMVFAAAAIFVCAAGARPYLGYILLLPQAATLLFLGLKGRLTWLELGLFSNPLVLTVCLIVIGQFFERTTYGEFRMRRLAKLRQQALEQALRSLEQSNRELDNFARAVAHDLQQPLHTVTGFLDLLLTELASTELEGAAAGYIEHALGSTGRMSRRISTLLDYTRVDTRLPALVSVELDALLAEVRADLHSAIERSGVVFELQSLPTVRGDRQQLALLFQNLLDNAIKYRREDVAARIVVRPGEIHDGFQRIWVEDNGVGFESARSAEVFEAFRRLQQRANTPGLGLGLATCAKIVRRHGGQIGVEASPDEGARFYFTLRVEPVESAVAGGGV